MSTNQRINWAVLVASLLTVFSIAGKGGCESTIETTKASEVTRIKNKAGTSTVANAQKFTFENHDYLLVTFEGEGGGALTHAESCPCRPTPKVEKQ